MDRAQLRRAVAVGAVIGLAAAVVAVLVLRPGAGPDGALPVPGEGRYAGLEVEVLNGAAVDGLARAVTNRLRQAGIDVVFFGTAGEERDSTVLLVRRGDSAGAVPVREALGLGRIVLDPDDRLLLDVTVLLGRDAAALGRDP